MFIVGNCRHLEHNRISTIREGSLHGLESLQTLYLYSNRISVIEGNAFTNLTNLKTLTLGRLYNCTCNAVKELQTLQKRNVTVSYTCPQSLIKGAINPTMVDLACSGNWTKWYKTAECIEKAGQTITPYRRKCETQSGKDAKGTCIGLDTKTEQCIYNKESNPVKNSITGKVKGRITLTEVTVNGTKVTNTDLSRILSQKGRDYDELVEDSEKGLLLLYRQSNENVLNVKIIRITVGSLIIDYVITLKVHGEETLKDVKLPTLTKDTIIYPNSSIFYGQGSGILSISDYDECKESVDDCDNNAYCITFPDRISYSCQCKDSYVGNGFKCESDGLDKKVEAKDWVFIVIVSTVAVVFVALLILLICCLKRRNRMRMTKKCLDVKSLTLFVNKQEESKL